MIDLHNMSILIADDIETMCKSIRSMLKILRFGKEFHFAHNGCEACQILKRSSVDLAIIDWNMPLMNGNELLEHIRQDKALRDMPVIMITTEATSEIVAEAAESDIDAYLLKPITVKMLEDKIAYVVDKANNPSAMDSHLKTARMFEEFGDIDAAIEETKQAIRTEPLSSKPIRMLGYYYYKKNDLKNAEKHFLNAAKMNRLDVFAFHHLGEIYLKRNDIDNAARFLDKAMQISPRNVARGIHFGKVLVQKKNIRKAKHVFEKTISLADNPLTLREEIADFCLENEIYDYAASLMEFILKQVPERQDILLKLSMAYEQLNDFKKALKFLIEAEKRDPGNVEIKMRITKIYFSTGQKIRADAVLKKVLAIDPENTEAQELFRKNI